MNEDSSPYNEWTYAEPVKYSKASNKDIWSIDELTGERAVWYGKDGFKKIVVLDEHILHGSSCTITTLFIVTLI